MRDSRRRTERRQHEEAGTRGRRTETEGERMGGRQRGGRTGGDDRVDDARREGGSQRGTRGGWVGMIRTTEGRRERRRRKGRSVTRGDDAEGERRGEGVGCD